MGGNPATRVSDMSGGRVDLNLNKKKLPPPSRHSMFLTTVTTMLGGEDGPVRTNRSSLCYDVKMYHCRCALRSSSTSV